MTVVITTRNALGSSTPVAGRKLDFQGDRIREGFKGRVLGGNGVGPL